MFQIAIWISNMLYISEREYPKCNTNYEISILVWNKFYHTQFSTIWGCSQLPPDHNYIPWSYIILSFIHVIPRNCCKYCQNIYFGYTFLANFDMKFYITYNYEISNWRTKLNVSSSFIFNNLKVFRFDSVMVRGPVFPETVDHLKYATILEASIKILCMWSNDFL